MGRKCCVYDCKTGYETKNGIVGEKLSVYRFPTDDNAREAWVKAIPNNVTVKTDSVVCAAHWPPGFEQIKKNGKLRPKDPPSVWSSNIPLSQLRTPPVKPRTTTRTSSVLRNVKADEMNVFEEGDSVTFLKLKEVLLAGERELSTSVIAYMDDNVLNVQSTKLLNGVPLFIIKIAEYQKFENFHFVVRCTATTLSTNRITTLKTWSAFEENVRFLNSLELDNKKEIINQQLQAMGTKSVGKPLYTTDTIIRAFRYFATSRCLYHILKDDYQLPSVQTLTRITSKVAKIDESNFSTAVFKSVTKNQKLCVILQDEIYVKKTLLYHGGQVFGKSVDNPEYLAKTVLGIMVSCLFGGPTYLSKLLPISRLNSSFLKEQIQASIECIKAAGGKVMAVISDGNRNNQAFFRLCDADPQTPWKTESGMYLLYDYVHLLKNIRNNWLTEATGELEFDDEGVTRTAKWSHLRDLYKLESDSESLVTLSDLTEVAVSPKPIERQKVSTCLKVFSEKTYQALLHHPGMENVSNVFDTAVFIQKVLNWWKILNVRTVGMDIRHNDDLQAAISDPEDTRLATILQFGDMAQQMRGRQGKREKQLTCDTAKALFHTCNGLVDLCRHLLSTSHKYVLFGQFSTDPLEKEFSKLRQGAGGTYFINVQQIVEKSNINKAKLLLSLKVDNEIMNSEESGHSCDDCSFELESDQKACETVDNIEELEASVPVETKSALIYIAGYVTRKDSELDDVSLLNQTTFYHEKFGGYTNSLDRGGLNIPSDRACQWTIFSFVVFNVVKDRVCRKSFIKIALTLSDMYEFGMEERHARILSNILIKNHCKASTPRSSKEPALKRLKLS